MSFILKDFTEPSDAFVEGEGVGRIEEGLLDEANGLEFGFVL